MDELKAGDPPATTRHSPTADRDWRNEQGRCILANGKSVMSVRSQRRQQVAARTNQAERPRGQSIRMRGGVLAPERTPGDRLFRARNVVVPLPVPGVAAG